MRHFFDVFELFCVNRFIKLESVIFLIESPHMKHKHCFAIKVDCEEDERRDSVDSHGVEVSSMEVATISIHIWVMKWWDIWWSLAWFAYFA